ncbi:hypothetical protein [Bradyrhizobium genosp. A]|uniref:hypothetical protein n=1 Tax=Bradyrhizobium genosp. A TaxID=83626 RepID=UPI003CE81AEE
MAAWLVFGLIVFATLSPIGLRPETGHVRIERFAAYALLGALFVAAYPHHFTRTMSLVLAAAILLEVLQHLTPDRHGHLIDAMEKFMGGVAGCSFTRLTQILSRKL